MAGRYWVETLGCPKNQVDSEKLAGTIERDGYVAAARPEDADLVVVNTCAFIEAARAESIETILDLSSRRPQGSRLVVTGCMAERYGQELADAMPEADLVAGFGVPVTLARRAGPSAGAAGSPGAEAGAHGRAATGAAAKGAAAKGAPARGVPVALQAKGDGPARGQGAGEGPVPSFDLLNLPRPPAAAPWAYVKVAEGCDRHCGFCAIPSFRGRQRSRAVGDILAEVEALGVQEAVLVAQDLASYGRDRGEKGAILDLVAQVSARVARTRLLYLYPSELSDGLIEVMGDTGCHYFDLSLQHASRPHLRRMRRWGDGARFAERIARIRAWYPDAALRSSFIVGYPGETEEDHDALLRFLEEVELDWCGLFAFSPEEGTYAVGQPDPVPAALAAERLAECSEVADRLTARRRQALVGQRIEVLVDEPGVGRSHREAPEIDGVVRIPRHLQPGSFATVTVLGAEGPDLDAAESGPPAALAGGPGYREA